MNENAKKWVKALKSGEFKQTKHRLCRIDKDGNILGHCCLGVACELYQEEVGNLEFKAIEKCESMIIDGHSGDLPCHVKKWLGLTECNGHFGEYMQSLSGHNDSGRSFSEIADLIESEPKGLFSDS